MKYLLLFLIFIFSQHISAQKKLIENNKQGYTSERGYVDNDSLKTGLWVSYTKFGSIYQTQKFKKGKKHGKEKVFYSSGQLEIERNYKDDKYDGYIKSYYEDGTLASKGKYKDGIMIGVHKTFHRNGNLWKYTKYDKWGKAIEYYALHSDGSILEDFEIDKKTGDGYRKKYNENQDLVEDVKFENKKFDTQKKYYDSGVLKEETTHFYEGSIPTGYLTKRYFENGKPRDEFMIEKSKRVYEINYTDSTRVKISYINGKKNGEVESFYLTGELLEQGTYKNGFQDGLWKTFYRNGQLKFMGKFISANPVLKDSTHVYFYPNGNLERKEFYKVQKSKYSNAIISRKTGIWEIYYLSGSPKETFEYNGDRSVKVGLNIKYFENGQIESKGQLNDDFKVGEWKFYYPNGTLKQTVSDYIFDSLNGSVKSYDSNGDLISEEFYDYGKKVEN